MWSTLSNARITLLVNKQVYKSLDVFIYIHILNFYKILMTKDFYVAKLIFLYCVTVQTCTCIYTCRGKHWVEPFLSKNVRKINT